MRSTLVRLTYSKITCVYLRTLSEKHTCGRSLPKTNSWVLFTVNRFCVFVIDRKQRLCRCRWFLFVCYSRNPMDVSTTSVNRAADRRRRRTTISTYRGYDIANGATPCHLLPVDSGTDFIQLMPLFTDSRVFLPVLAQSAEIYNYKRLYLLSCLCDVFSINYFTVGSRKLHSAVRCCK